MKRTLVIFPVGAKAPDWFVYPIGVSKDGTAPATARASLVLGNIPASDGVQSELRPEDTIKSALARAGFARVTKTAARNAPVVAAPEPPKGVWSRVKGLFRRAPR